MLGSFPSNFLRPADRSAWSGRKPLITNQCALAFEKLYQGLAKIASMFHSDKLLKFGNLKTSWNYLDDSAREFVLIDANYEKIFFLLFPFFLPRLPTRKSQTCRQLLCTRAETKPELYGSSATSSRLREWAEAKQMLIYDDCPGCFHGSDWEKKSDQVRSLLKKQTLHVQSCPLKGTRTSLATTCALHKNTS